jgi:hypothetical protein
MYPSPRAILYCGKQQKRRYSAFTPHFRGEVKEPKPRAMDMTVCRNHIGCFGLRGPAGTARERAWYFACRATRGGLGCTPCGNRVRALGVSVCIIGLHRRAVNTFPSIVNDKTRDKQPLAGPSGADAQTRTTRVCHAAAAPYPAKVARP